MRDNVELLMRERNIRTQVGLAKVVGIAAPTLSDWMRGAQPPSSRSLQKLANGLGVTVSELLTPRVRQHEKPSVDLSKDVWIPIKGKVWATPFRISAGKPLGLIRAHPGEQDCFALIVEGASMLPVFKPGSIVICRPEIATLSAYALDDDEADYVPYEMMVKYHLKDAIVHHDGETTLKRIVVQKTQGPKYDLFMTSVNPDKKQFPDVKLHRGDDWQLQAIVKRPDEEPEYLK